MALPREPVLHVAIFVPPELAGRAEGCVLRYHGRLDSAERLDTVQAVYAIHARVRQAEVGPFVSALMADTNGRARTSMRLCEFWVTQAPPPADPTTGVREPRPDAPVLRNGAIAVPEPEAEGE